MSKLLRYVAEETYLAMLAEVEIESVRRGLPGDWHGLRRRRQALAQRIEENRFERTNAKSPAWPFRLEHHLTIRALRALLLPAVQRRLSGVLRSPDIEPSLWMPIDVQAYAGVRATVLRREHVAEADVLAALERCARAPTCASAVSALRALSELYDVRESLDPLFDVDQLARARYTLAEAVTATMPHSACNLIGTRIWVDFSHEVSAPSEEDIDRTFYMYWAKDVRWSKPIWHQLCDNDSATPDTHGIWFVSGAQEVFEGMRHRRLPKREEGCEQFNGPERESKQALAAADSVTLSNSAETAERVDEHSASTTSPRPALVLPEPPPPRSDDLETERERERQRTAEMATQVAAIKAAERREVAHREERARRRREHRLHVPLTRSAANRKEVLLFLKRRGLTPADLTPEVRTLFRRDFRM